MSQSTPFGQFGIGSILFGRCAAIITDVNKMHIADRAALHEFFTSL